MALDTESRGAHLVKVTRAAVDVEDLAAALAMKVMVVIQSSRLIAGGLTRNLNRDQQALFHQRLNIAIDRRDAQSGNLILGVVENLLWPQRAPDLVKRVADRVALTSLSLHLENFEPSR